MQNATYLAQVGHAAVPYGILLTVGRFAGFVPAFFVAIGILVFATWKEWWFDLREEKDPPQTWKGSLLDYVFYLVGIGLALGVLVIPT